MSSKANKFFNAFSVLLLLNIICVLMFAFNLRSTNPTCHRQVNVNLKLIQNNVNVPVIHVITPTFERTTQLADLTRLGQSLILVDHLHWILVEDSYNKTTNVIQFISFMKQLIYKYQSNMIITHLNQRTPERYQRHRNEKYHAHARGVIQRNLALQYLYDSELQPSIDHVIYFADDDNTYDVRLFDEMRYTKYVSVWPVGLVGGMMAERPIVDVNTGKVIAFNSKFNPKRKYPIDMAAFAVNWSLLLTHQEAKFQYNLPIGTLESNFLNQILDGIHQLEPKAKNCSQVLVWHTRTLNFKPTYN